MFECKYNRKLVKMKRDMTGNLKKLYKPVFLPGLARFHTRLAMRKKFSKRIRACFLTSG
jgi:hypothetical protein